jgi:dihydrofolate synthase/folylpolyglutamate synthase
MSTASTTQWLYALKNHGSKFGVERMALFAGALGNPERAFPSILVAGSNGKGSTAAMLEAIYRAGGLRTGLYTSPHLVRLGERVQIDRISLSDALISAYVEELAVVARGIADQDPEDSPSFFEFMTAMAFLEFNRRRVDVGIVEVGLGGRLDATNILSPAASVVTSISLEHTNLLGDTLEKIAAEKGGIIKVGVPVVLGLLPDAAEQVLRKIARERNAPVFSVRERFNVGEKVYPETNLAGAHQRANAALALLVVEVLRGQFPVDDAVARAALRKTEWAARWQTFTLSRSRQLIVDAAHNAEGAAAIEPLLEKLTPAPTIITGALGKERAEPLIATLARHARALVFVHIGQERACSFEELASCVPQGFRGTISCTSVEELFPALGECAVGEDGGAVVVVGSVYLAGEVLTQFLYGEKSGEPFLQDSLPVSRAF